MTENLPAAQPRARLGALATEIRREVDAAEADFQSAVAHAIRAGELTEAKAQVKHGEWLAWLEANVDVSERHAQRFMQLARNATRVADLPTIREAVAVLAEPKRIDPPPLTRDEAERLTDEARTTVREMRRLAREAFGMRVHEALEKSWPEFVDRVLPAQEPADVCEPLRKMLIAEGSGVEDEARSRLAERRRRTGSDAETENPHLREAELQIEIAFIHQERAASALLDLAQRRRHEHPKLAAAAADLAAKYIDRDSGPWDHDEGEARYLHALAVVRAEGGER